MSSHDENLMHNIFIWWINSKRGSNFPVCKIQTIKAMIWTEPKSVILLYLVIEIYIRFKYGIKWFLYVCLTHMGPMMMALTKTTYNQCLSESIDQIWLRLQHMKSNDNVWTNSESVIIFSFSFFFFQNLIWLSKIVLGFERFKCSIKIWDQQNITCRYKVSAQSFSEN